MILNEVLRVTANFSLCVLVFRYILSLQTPLYIYTSIFISNTYIHLYVFIIYIYNVYISYITITIFTTSWYLVIKIQNCFSK